MPEGSELLVNPDPSARVHVHEVGDRAEQFAAFVDSVGPYLLHTAELLCGDSGGGIEWNFAYLYSPHKQPAQWESPLGPVMITPIADTGWWFEKSPND